MICHYATANNNHYTDAAYVLANPEAARICGAFKQGSVTIINLILNVAKYHILTTVLLILWTLISISSCETLI